MSRFEAFFPIIVPPCASPSGTGWNKSGRFWRFYPNYQISRPENTTGPVELSDKCDASGNSK
jgi:hypothetical protein